MPRKARDEEPIEPTDTQTEPAKPTELVMYGGPIVPTTPGAPAHLQGLGMTPAGPPPPPPKRYIIRRGQQVMTRTGQTYMRAGKIIDAGNYDIGKLLDQGVELAELDEG